MTISEIAKTHEGRRFRRSSFPNLVFTFINGTAYDGSCALACAVDTLLADDWEFVPETMGFVEAVKRLTSRIEGGATQIRRVSLEWAVRRQFDVTAPLYLIRPNGGYGGNWTPDVQDVLATDWIAEEAK